MPGKSHKPIAFTRDAGLLATSKYFGTAMGFVRVIISVRLLGPVDYGMAALVVSCADLLRSFASVKSANVTTRYIASFHSTKRDEELKSICKFGYAVDMLIFLTVFVVISVTSGWIADYILNKPKAAWLMIIYAASFPFLSLTGTSYAIMSALHHFHWLAALEIFESIVTLISVSYLLLTGFGVEGMILGTAVGNVIAGLTMMVAATYALAQQGVGLWWNAHLGVIAPLRKELSAFFGWNYLLVTLNGVVAQVPMILLARFRSPAEAGFYRLAVSIMVISSHVEASLGRVAYPILSAGWSTGDMAGLHKTLQRWAWRVGLPIGALLLLTIPFLPMVIPLVFGLAYRQMVFGTQLMMLGAAVEMPLFWLNSFYYASGKIALWTLAYGFCATISLGCAWLFIQEWGFSGLVGFITIGKILFMVCMTVPVIRVWKRA
jgi:O-antigen/teichoic acid export membrane protein